MAKTSMPSHDHSKSLPEDAADHAQPAPAADFAKPLNPSKEAEAEAAKLRVPPNVQRKADKFRPERPIVLNESNTGFRTKVEVMGAVEHLRAMAWLVTYGETARPIHLSFQDPGLIPEFLKDAESVGCKIPKRIAKPGDDSDFDADPDVMPKIPGAELTDENTRH